MIGADFGQYHILEQLGQGGMATVYKAYDVRDSREVAVKVIRADILNSDQADRLLLRFEIEKRLAGLRHPNIVRVIDYGDHAGVPYLVMEYVPGGTLKKLAGRRMHWREAAALLAPVARALHYLHQHDVVHRDIKPSNILLADGGRPLLSDFGIAKLLNAGDTASLTNTGMGIGTPDYMAPEEAAGRAVGPATDIYALGIVYYELITGRTPFRADTPMAVLLKHMQDPLPRPTGSVPNLPVDVERMLFKALAKRPDDRYGSADEFADVLDKIAAGQTLSGREAPGADGRGRSVALGLTAMGLVIGLGLMVILVALAALASGLVHLPTGAAPSPTVPKGFVYVTNVSGSASSQSGSAAPGLITRGALLPTGPGSRVTTGEGQLQLGLPDGALVYVGPQSELELARVADPQAGVTSTLILLSRGKALAVVLAQSKDELALQVTGGPQAEAFGAATDTRMGAQYDPGSQQLDVDCLAGQCQLSASGASVALAGGQHSWLNASGIPFDPDAARQELWAFAGLDQPATATPASPLQAVATASATKPPAATASSTARPSATASATATFTTSPSPTAFATHTRVPVVNTRPAPTATFSPPTDVPPTDIPPTPASQPTSPPQPTDVPPSNPTPTPVPPSNPTPTPVPPI